VQVAAPGDAAWNIPLPSGTWKSSKRSSEIVGDISNVRLDRSETIMFLRHTNGMLEGRDAVDGRQLFSTNVRTTNVKRAYFMNGRRTLALLIGDAEEIAGRKERDTLSVSEVRLLDVPPNEKPRIADAKRAVPRCFTPEQFEANYLPKEPPGWCIEMAKWPYNTSEWQEWLAKKRRGENPNMPNVPPNAER
jgi:hypothetical protein